MSAPLAASIRTVQPGAGGEEEPVLPQDRLKKAKNKKIKYKKIQTTTHCRTFGVGRDSFGGVGLVISFFF